MSLERDAVYRIFFFGGFDFIFIKIFEILGEGKGLEHQAPVGISTTEYQTKMMNTEVDFKIVFSTFQVLADTRLLKYIL